MSSRTYSAKAAKLQAPNPVHNISSPRPFAIQAKMTVGQPNDKYEQEADQVADQVVTKLQRMENPEKVSQMKPDIQREGAMDEEELQMKPDLQREGGIEEEELQMKPDIQREGGMEEEELQMKPDIQKEGAMDEEELQMKSENGGAPVVSEQIESTISQRKGSGSPLPDLLRSKLEQAIGADFTGVKVHTDQTSDTLNRSLSAKAFTAGQDIFFKSGEFNPNSTAGQKLLSHELTHTVQQNPHISKKANK